MAKVVCISDTHMQHEGLVLPEGDILIHSGDFGGIGSHMDHFKFSQWMGKQPFKHKLCTPGNHDRYSEQQTIAAKEMFKENGVTLLIDEEITIDRKKIYMSPWTPRYGQWYWMRDRGRHIGVMWDNIPTRLDILVTHGPPQSILDYSIYDHVHCGCEELMKEVMIKQPKHHVFGHIHYFGGQSDTLGKTTFWNAAICDEDYKPTNKITEFEI